MDPQLRKLAGVLYPQDLQLDSVAYSVLATANATRSTPLAYEYDVLRLLSDRLEALSQDQEWITQEQEAIRYFLEHPSARTHVLETPALSCGTVKDQAAASAPLKLPYTVGVEKGENYGELETRVTQATQRLKSHKFAVDHLNQLPTADLPAPLKPFFNSVAATAASPELSTTIARADDTYALTVTHDLTLSHKRAQQRLRDLSDWANYACVSASIAGPTAYAGIHAPPMVGGEIPAFSVAVAMVALASSAATFFSTLATLAKADSYLDRAWKPEIQLNTTTLKLTSLQTDDVAILENIPAQKTEDNFVSKAADYFGFDFRTRYNGPASATVEYNPKFPVSPRARTLSTGKTNNSRELLLADNHANGSITALTHNDGQSTQEGPERQIAIRYENATKQLYESARVLPKLTYNDEAILFGDLNTTQRNAAAFAQLHGERVNELLAHATVFEGALQKTLYYAVVAEWAAQMKEDLYDVSFPTFNSKASVIENLVHPVIASQTVAAVPNSYDEREARTAIITGPNEGGKSVYATSVAIAHAMAQAGWPLLARNACMQTKDQIITQTVKPGDIDIAASRAGMEAPRMREVINRATNQTLIVLDETYTSTNPDEATAELQFFTGLTTAMRATTLLTTHYSSLITHADRTAGMRNLYAEVDDQKKPTYRILPGGSSDSNFEHTLAKHGADRTSLAALARERIASGDLENNSELTALLEE